MKRQKGQAIVEFAIVFPFLLMLLFGLIFSGLVFSDYMTLSNAARSSAREAALAPSKASDIASDYTNYFQTSSPLVTGIYQAPTFAIDPENTTPPHSIKVTISTTLNGSFPGVGALNYLGIMLPGQESPIQIQYFMHREDPV